jgi:hypothetical protein
MSTHAPNVVAREFHGQDITIGQAADPVAVVSRFRDLEAATPLPAESPAHLDRGSGPEGRRREAIGKTFHECLISHDSLVRTGDQGGCDDST